jgi:hypothetical protein
MVSGESKQGHIDPCKYITDFRISSYQVELELKNFSLVNKVWNYTRIEVWRSVLLKTDHVIQNEYILLQKLTYHSQAKSLM